MTSTPTPVGGPYFDDLHVGQQFDTAPSVTLTSGLAASHQAIVGDRLRLPLDRTLTALVTGRDTAVAHPCLVTDIAIGQSTLATHHVKANLFYRGLRFLSFPHIGDTLTTVTEVVGLRENAPKPNRAPTGLAALHIVTTDQNNSTVLDFYRCAMLPLSPGHDPGRVVHSDTLDGIGTITPEFVNPPGWNIAAYRDTVRGRHFDSDMIGRVYECSGDVVTSAPELARLSLNVAATHHDARVGTNGRLVYGGHTIGIALSQATRALPNILTVLGWESCDHTGPVHEGDTLTSRLHVEKASPFGEGAVVHLRSVVTAHGDDGSATDVLDWRYQTLMATTAIDAPS